MYLYLVTSLIHYYNFIGRTYFIFTALYFAFDSTARFDSQKRTPYLEFNDQ